MERQEQLFQRHAVAHKQDLAAGPILPNPAAIFMLPLAQRQLIRSRTPCHTAREEGQVSWPSRYGLGKLGIRNDKDTCL